MRRISILLALVASLFVTPALADFTGKDASAATITFKNPGTCTAVVCVPVFQLYDGTNVVALTTAGGDGVSNTLTGLPTYDRMLIYNGTTWDRWQGAIKAAPNAFAAGSLAIGAGVDGWSITDGLTTDAASTAGGTGTHSAKLRLMTTQLNNVALNQSSQITQETATATGIGAPADAAWVSGSGSSIAILKNIATGVAGPTTACSGAPCTTTIGNTGQMANVGGTDTKSIKCGSSVVYDASTSGSTQLVALSGATSVYVCGYSIMAGGTVNVKLITGTGAACVTGTASITPAYQLTAQAGLVDGSPEYRGLKGAASSELCINTSGAVAVQAIVYYTQF